MTGPVTGPVTGLELGDLDHEDLETSAEAGGGRGPFRPAAVRARKAWAPEVDAEVAALLRLLSRRCWLVAGRDDDAIAAVRRNEDIVRGAFNRLGWVLVVERDLVRLRKSPPPRPTEWAVEGPDPLTCAWFFILVAAAESLAPRVALSEIVTAARAAAGEAGVEVTGEMPERRAIVHALKLLDERGVVQKLDGDVEGFLHDDNAPVLLGIHHTRLLHVIANTGAGPDPATDPHEWLDSVRRENDAARRMRRRLVDDAVVHTCDLDDTELDWLSRRLRGDDGGPLAAAFGLSIERRAEGAAFVLPEENYRYDRELGPMPFPVSGTVPHAALLICDHATQSGVHATTEPGPTTPAAPPQRTAPADVGDHASGSDQETASSAVGPGPGPGWRALTGAQVLDQLGALAAQIGSGRGGWSADLVENPAALLTRVRDLLRSRDLLRLHAHPHEPGETVWWFSPATGRWPAPTPTPAAPRHTPPGTPAAGAEPEDATQPALFDNTAEGPVT